MHQPGALYPSILQGVPDGRRAPLPLLNPLLFGYAALMVGAPLASLGAAYNAALLRRWGLLATALGAGASAWLAAEWMIGRLYYDAGIHDMRLLLLCVRGLWLTIGIGLAVQHWPHARGHRLMRGDSVPLLWSVVAVFVVNHLILSHDALWLFARGLG